MAEFNCLKCGKPVHAFFSQPGDTVKCVHCAAKHIVPPEGSEGAAWREECERLQQQADAFYHKWMPWPHYLTGLAVLLMYILLKLQFHSLGGQTTVGVALFVTWIGAGIWSFLIFHRCYGYPLTLRAQYRNFRAWWIVGPLAIAGGIILLSELVINLMTA